MTHTVGGGIERRVPSWPEQILLPGQAAAPDGPVDMHMMYVAHFGFRRDLAAFAAAAAVTPVEDRATWAALSARWSLFATVLHHHHSGEDAGLWPLLLERTDEADRAVLDAMEAEHGEIDPILMACEAGFAKLAAGGDADTRNALVVRLCAGRESLGRHLAHEETEAITIIQRVLDQADWDRLTEEHFEPKDVSLPLLLSGIPWVAYRLPEPGLRKLLAGWPAPMRLLWRLTRRGFARRERRAFRYVGGR
jgi:hypothetical protein